MTNLRTLLWIYLWLLLIEGALRKWLIPSLDAPLMIIRDPLVVWIYFIAIQRGISFQNAFFLPNLFLAIATAVLSTLFGEGTIVVTIYGLRTDFLQIPLIFLIPQILNRDDVVRMGRFILLMSIPILILVIIQFRSPVDSLVNKNSFHTHYGTVRPSGPFSFVNGLVSFFDILAAFVLYGYLSRGTYKVWLIAVVTFMLMLGAACSGSRSCLVSIGVVVVVAVMCVLTRGKGGLGLIVAALIITLLLPILSTLSIFKDGTDQLTRRFDDAGRVEGGTGGFVDRFLGGFVGPLNRMSDAPLFGEGLGIGTNAGAALLTGDRAFTGGSEEEWGRLITESGSIFGLLLCLFRTALTFAIAKRAYDAFREDNVLPVLIFAGCGLLILNGQWGVPTTLGFAIFGGGLTLAACVDPDEEEDDEEEEEDEKEEEVEEDEESDHAAPAHTVS